MTSIMYPQTRRADVTETHFGHRIADPYRWLENDARHDPEVAEWARQQNDLARAYLDGLPGRDVFRKQLSELFDFEQAGVPLKRGDRYFRIKRQGLKNQGALHVRTRRGRAGQGIDRPQRLVRGQRRRDRRMGCIA